MANSDSPTHVHLLKDNISQMENNLKHLGNHVAQFGNALNKGSKAHAAKQHVPRVLHGTSPFSAKSLLSDTIGSVGGALGQAASSFGGDSSGSTLSSGQVMSELASAVTRAMKRNL